MVLAITWFVVAMAAALLIGAAIRVADRGTRSIDAPPVLPDDLTVDDVVGAPRTVPSVH